MNEIVLNQQNEAATKQQESSGYDSQLGVEDVHSHLDFDGHRQCHPRNECWTCLPRLAFVLWGTGTSPSK